METTFENKANILADLWIDYRGEPDFQDFVEYNDLGLPLAYAIANGIVESTMTASTFIEETFAVLLSGLGIEEDKGFESLSEILSSIGE
jgi:hypothetical protein